MDVLNLDVSCRASALATKQPVRGVSNLVGGMMQASGVLVFLLQNTRPLFVTIKSYSSRSSFRANTVSNPHVDQVLRPAPELAHAS